MLARRCARIKGLRMLSFSDYEYSATVRMNNDPIVVEFNYKAAIGNDNSAISFTSSPCLLINGYKDPSLNTIFSSLKHFTVEKTDNPLELLDTTGIDYMLEHISRSLNKDDLSPEKIDNKLLSTLITFFYTHIHFILDVKLDDQKMSVDTRVATYKNNLFEHWIKYNENKEIISVRIESKDGSMAILLEI